MAHLEQQFKTYIEAKDRWVAFWANYSLGHMIGKQNNSETESDKLEVLGFLSNFFGMETGDRAYLVGVWFKNIRD